jgi:hypothetical protein
VSPRNRFFAGFVLAGRLHVRGIPDRDPWDPSRLEWATELEIDPNLVVAAGDRKIGTREELARALREPTEATPTQFVWIHESLVDEVRRVWERSAAAEQR